MNEREVLKEAGKQGLGGGTDSNPHSPHTFSSFLKKSRKDYKMPKVKSQQI